MAKDYARATFKTARAKRRQRSRHGLLLAIFLFFVLGVLAPCGWYLYQHDTGMLNKDHAMAWMGELKAFLHKQKPQVAMNETVKTQVVNPAPEEPSVHFDFYTELPKMQVTLPATQTEAGKGTPPPVAAHQTKSDVAPLSGAQAIMGQAADATFLSNTAQTKAKALEADHTKVMASPSAAAQYIVQVGAYKSDSTASEMRVSILLAGFDVSVVKTTVGDQVVYRIQQGPYNSLAQAKSAQKKLQAKGYDGVVQKLS
jgi:cell division protein FtsN